MIVWSLTTETRDGLSTNLYLSESQTYQALIRDWFPEDYHLPNHRAAVAALAIGIPELKKWISTYLDKASSLEKYLVTQHDCPWSYGAVQVDARLDKLRLYIAESTSPLANTQAILDILDGPPQLCSCGRKYRECVSYELGEDAQHGDLAPLT
jgi:hypothetical protein